MTRLPLAARRATAAAAVIVALLALSISIAIAGGRQPTKGPVPPDAIQSGTFNKALIPDFIPAIGRDGQIVGYVARDLAIPDGPPNDAPIPVYADDLSTLVGYMQPGRGFVGVDGSTDGAPVTPVTVGGD
jgi:hypothetical protein